MNNKCMKRNNCYHLSKIDYINKLLCPHLRTHKYLLRIK